MQAYVLVKIMSGFGSFWERFLTSWRVRMNIKKKT